MGFFQAKWTEKFKIGCSTLYISNFPENWSCSALKESLSKLGDVKDVFIPGKRNAEGKRFAFVRFDSKDIDEILAIAKGLYMDRQKQTFGKFGSL